MFARMTHALHQRLEHHAAKLDDQPITLGALTQAHGPALASVAYAAAIAAGAWAWIVEPRVTWSRLAA
jgi:hypothetical protein